MIYELLYQSRRGTWIIYSTADSLDWVKSHALLWSAVYPDKKLYVRPYLLFGDGAYEIESWDVWEAGATLVDMPGRSPDSSLDKRGPLESA